MSRVEKVQPRNMAEKPSMNGIHRAASGLWKGAVWIDKNIVRNLFHDKGENDLSRGKLVESSRLWLYNTGKDYVAKHVKKRISRRSMKERTIEFKTHAKKATSNVKF